MAINGTADGLVPYKGGPVIVYSEEYGTIISTENNIAFWRKNNGCSEKVDRKVLGKSNATTTERFIYGDCPSGAPVILYRITGGKHRKPGMQSRVARFFGVDDNGLVADEVIWAFFDNFK